MSSQEVTPELLLGDGSNYKSWAISICNAFMYIDPDLRHIFSRIIFPSNISKNPSEVELRCLSLNHHACNILVESLSRDAYFAIMSSDNDCFVDAHDLWTRYKSKYFKSMCTAYAPSIACATNLSKGEEQERWQQNDESTSPTSSSPTSYKALLLTMIVEMKAMVRRNMMIARMNLHHHKLHSPVLLPLIMMTGKMRSMMWVKKKFTSSTPISKRKQDDLDEVVEKKQRTRRDAS
jgi:hypothetical protein